MTKEQIDNLNALLSERLRARRKAYEEGLTLADACARLAAYDQCAEDLETLLRRGRTDIPDGVNLFALALTGGLVMHWRDGAPPNGEEGVFHFPDVGTVSIQITRVEGKSLSAQLIEAAQEQDKLRAELAAAHKVGGMAALEQLVFDAEAAWFKHRSAAVSQPRSWEEPFIYLTQIREAIDRLRGGAAIDRLSLASESEKH